VADYPREPRWLIRVYRQLATYINGLLACQSGWQTSVALGLKALGILASLGLALLFAYTLVLIPFTPSIAAIQKANIDQPAVLVAADGRRLATLKPMNREWVRLKQISPHVITALLATEDHRFYHHFGIDLLRTMAGVVHTVLRDPEGGSTLTQQLARNLYPEIGRQRTLTRKN